MHQEHELHELKSQGFALLRENRLAEAKRLFTQITDVDENDAEAWHALGIINGMLGDFDAAGNCCRRAIKLQPAHCDAHLNLGNILLLQSNYEDAIEHYNSALRFNPNYPPALINLGKALLIHGEYSEAAACFQKLIHLGIDLLNAHNNLGYAQLMLKNYDAAIASYHQALRIDPNHDETHFNLGNVYMKVGRNDDALASFERAVRINPNHVGAFTNIGSIFSNKGKYDEATEKFRSALRIEPSSAEAHNNLGLALKAQGNIDQAVLSFKRAIELKADHADAYYNLGSALSDQGDLDGAISNYRRAIELKPQIANAYNNLGFALSEQGHFDEAIASYQRAIELNPKYALAYYNLANVLEKQGSVEQALKNYRSAIALNRGYSDAYKNMAKILGLKGRLAEAIAVYRHWLEDEPDNAFALHMLAACSGQEIPARCSDGYLKKTFDDFSGEFDQKLTTLGYRGPALIADAVKETFRIPKGDMIVLDAGCGTGLCAPGVRPYARRLVGVDLSPGMLAKASERGLYDDLVTAELTSYLRECPENTYDLVISADTLIYFGALEELLERTASALRVNGRFMFTVERADSEDTPTGYLLSPHGRYSHTEEYVRRVLTNVGLSIETMTQETIRMESGKPAGGLMVVAIKAKTPDSSSL
jgi:predicted TPR repeat methyltransferase